MTTSSGPKDPYATGDRTVRVDETTGPDTLGDGVGADGTMPNTEQIPPNEHADLTPGGDGSMDTQATVKRKVEHTRVAGTWVSLVFGALVLLVLLVFIVQNNKSTRFQIFGFDFSLPLGVAMLAAALAGALIMALVGGIRIIQLRRAYKKA